MTANRNDPPAVLERLVESLCDVADVDIMLGDLHELYRERVQSGGRLYANTRYLLDFCGLLFHGAFRRKKKYGINPMIMLNNYILVAIRYMLRHKAHNFINIAGLSLGLSVSLIIGLFVWNELRYDRFHVKGDRIYLLPMTWKIGGTSISVAEATSAAGPFVQGHFPQVETMTRIKHEALILNYKGTSFDEKEVSAVDSTFFDVFTFPMIAGDARSSLRNPLSLVLTERAAIKYFGADWANQDILSKALEGQNKKLYPITGVVKNPPAYSHIQFDMLLSMNSLPGEKETNWDNSAYTTYLLLQPGTSPATIVSQIPEMLTTHAGAWAAKNMEFDLVHLHQLYLNNLKYAGLPKVSDMRYVYIFSAIAVMILVIALINYMNLSTARSLERAREVGVRRVVGAFRIQLFMQFICESFMVTLISMILAIGLAKLGIPVFNNISGKEIDLGLLFRAEWAGYLGLLLILVTGLGGFYPALVLSGFKPVSVLKGNVNSPSGMSLRKVLVVAQFAISIVLIISTLMIQGQLRFMSSAKLGFDKDQLVALSLDSVSRGRLSTLKKEMAGIANVESIVATVHLPVDVSMHSALSFDGRDRQLVAILGTASEFTATTGTPLIAGRDFSPESENRATWEFLLNESALKFYSVSAEEALGKEITLWGTKGVVVGVVRDFHFAPLHQAIQPLVVSAGRPNVSAFGYLLVRVQPGDYSTLLGAIERKWKELVPESPFEFTFLNEQYNQLYLTESRLNKVMNVFSTFAIVIACLGLFGLSSYTILRRTKELGIRKVMGASPARLIALVSGGFVRMVIISFVISVPLCWYAMNAWLSNFYYHIEFNWWVVAGTGMSAGALAILTVAYHAAEAAYVNPVKSLRAE